MIKKSPPESQGERALGAVMRNARLEAIERRTQAMATHSERLKAAITGSGFAARYPASFLRAATKNDLISVCRIHGIAVAGLPGV